MNTKITIVNRLLSFALCVCMVLAMLPVIPLTAEAAGGQTLYLKPNSNWTQANARFAAYFFGNGDTWVSMTDSNGDGIYECTAPSGYSGVIFCRMNPSASANNWNNKWNQTSDLTVPTNGNTLYTVASGSWDGSSNAQWSTPACSSVGHDFVDGKCSRCDVVRCQVEGHSFANNVCSYCKLTRCQIEGHSFVNDVCSRCSEQGRKIYFQNNWLWTDIAVHYWKGDVNNGWPGQTMEFFGKAKGEGEEEYDHYVLTIPTDIDGYIISGMKPDNSGRDQTPDITSGWYDGITYCMFYEIDHNAYRTFEICKAFPGEHLTPETVAGNAATCTKDGLTDGTQCPRCKMMLTEQQPIAAQGHSFNDQGVCTACGTGTMKIFFQNNWAWENISLYYWFDGSTLDNAWPGTLMEHHGKATVDFEEGEREFDYYVLTVPANVAGIIINGTDPMKPEEEQNRQTFNISASDLYNGVTFYINGEEEKVEGMHQYCYVDSFSITKDFPCAIGHAEVQHEAQAVTCTEKGWAAYVTCENCNYSTYEEIPAPGHQDANDNGLCDSCSCLMQPARLAQVSVSLKGNIAVNYYMLLTQEVRNDEAAYMKFTLADGTVYQVPAAEGVEIVDEGVTYYVYSCAVNAKEMTDKIVSQFFYADTATQEHPYYVKTYGKHILENPKYDNEKTKNLIEAMLNYGAASQIHFGHKTDDLANDGVTVAPDYSDVSISGFDAVADQGTEGAKLYSASLILKSETTLRLFFTGKITATYQGQELTVKQRSGLYYVDVVGISAKNLDENVTVTISDSTGTADVFFNPMSYCQGVLNDTSGAFSSQMKDLVCALYLYNQAANAYFE